MGSQTDQQRVCALLTEAMTVICKNGLTYNNKFSIEGLLGITMDDNRMFLVNVRETVFKNQRDGKQQRSDSFSKAGVLAAKPPQQAGRGGSISQGRPGVGGNQMNPQSMQQKQHMMMMQQIQQKQQMQQKQQLQKRRGGAVPQSILPMKRPNMGVPGPQGPPGPPKGSPGRGGGVIGSAVIGAGIPQEWAALMQLQQQQPPQQTSTRGRGKMQTARRGVGPRGMVTTQIPTERSPEALARAQARKDGTSGVEFETKEEADKRHATQAKSRSERAQRRHSGYTPTKGEEGYKGSLDDSADSTGRPSTTDADSTHSHDTSGNDDRPTPQNDEKPAQNDDRPTQNDDRPAQNDDRPAQNDVRPAHNDDDNKSAKEENTSTHEETNEGRNEKESTDPPKEGQKEGDTEGKTEEGGDGSWLLKNSSWLLGETDPPSSENQEEKESPEMSSD